jgi:hypothetical protein
VARCAGGNFSPRTVGRSPRRFSGREACLAYEARKESGIGEYALRREKLESGGLRISASGNLRPMQSKQHDLGCPLYLPLCSLIPGWPCSLRGQTWRYRLASRARQFISVGSFRTRRRGPFGRNGAILRHFERDAIPYALETDCVAGHVGLELRNPCLVGSRSYRRSKSAKP